MSKDEKKKKPGFMTRLFSSKKMSIDDEKENKAANSKRLQKMHSVDPGSLQHESSKEAAAKAEKSKSKDDSAVRKEPTPSKSTDSQRANGAAARPKEPKKKPKQDSSGKARRKKKRSDKKGELKIDSSKEINQIFPCTPEIILEYHKNKPFLSSSEEWLIVELNEFECLVDCMKIVKIIAKHSKFFEVEPDDLWEEFFEWVDDCPAYDEVINYDIWQEFRDKKYPM